MIQPGSVCAHYQVIMIERSTTSAGEPSPQLVYVLLEGLSVCSGYHFVVHLPGHCVMDS